MPVLVGTSIGNTARERSGNDCSPAPASGLAPTPPSGFPLPRSTYIHLPFSPSKPIAFHPYR
ncbi:hypothetical protein COCNU_06G011920 [Cocos nucifera]|uniref:Uncharacterized protein n=1 Tax=Cocos nucifera TaxID=13894 RepID=A0A8K0N2W4_COCNU|nr:hypothetical protein COCNU_06G011920 [Cocos nucifera]